MHSGYNPPASMRAYRALLHLYPASFRQEYGEEMAADVRHRLRDAPGPLARAATWAAIAGETLANAFGVHREILTQDVRYTARTLRRAPGFALTAIGIVAFGIGANTAAFSVTDFVLLRPLPFRDATRLVMIWQQSAGYARMELAPPTIRDWKRGATSFASIGTYKNYSATLVGAGEPLRVSGAMISHDLFPTLAVEAALGRTFVAGEELRPEPGALLSDRLWRAAFGADPNVLGRKLVLDETVYVIAGVMPRGFAFPRREAEVWVPISFSPGDAEARDNNEVYAVGRLKPGVTIDTARAEMDVLAAQTAKDFPKENGTTSATVTDLRDELSREARALVLALNGAALCVLLIVCANLANLLLARALGRRQELAVRAAMGAGRERLVRQLATESVVIATIGGAAGVLLAAGIVPLLWRLVPAALPTDATPGVDLRVLAFAAALTLVTSLGFGLAPMLRAGADADARGLRDGARTIGGAKEWLRGALVVGEVIASVVLLIATGLLIRTLWTIQARNPGFNTDGVLTMRTEISSRYAVTSRRAEYYSRILEQIRALPGVTDAAYISGLPMVWGGGIWPVGINGVELERRSTNTASLRFVTPGFFRTLRIPLHRGRDVAETDNQASQHVAVVSESFVGRYWPGQDVIGKTFHFAMRERTIVGVVGNVRVRGLERESEPQVYLPYRQQPDGGLWGYTPKDLVIASTTALDPLVPAVREILHSADPQQPIMNVRAMTDIVGSQTAARSVQVRVLAGFALLAFLLAAIGIHGLLAFTVSQRTAEIGVRIALGAQRGDILRMVLKRGLLLVGAGLVPGLALAYLAGRALQSLLIGVSAIDPPTIAATALLVAVMAVVGTIFPVMRALRIDPIRAIRAE
jgi:predicted permease